MLGFFDPPFRENSDSLHLCFHFVSLKKNEVGGGGGVFLPAQAVLTGLLGSWNERTRPTKWD